MRRISVLLFLSLLVSGCAHKGISKESVRLADRTLSYPVIRENPEQFKGQYAHLGGAIAKVRNTSEGGELEIVQLKLDGSGKPEPGSGSEGRFIARGSRFMDPLVFKPGSFVSLVGEIKGTEVAPIDDVQYRYPVIFIKELHLWKPEDYQDAGSRFHFGLGLGFFQGF